MLRTPHRHTARQMQRRSFLSQTRPQCHREALEDNALRRYLLGVIEDQGSDHFCSLNHPLGTSASCKMLILVS